MSESSKTRVPNFSSSEKAHLLRLIAQKYAFILEDKKTDRASSVKKEKAWQEIENDFNASSTSTTFRNAICLKKCYENRKKELRKLLAEERKETMLTGGGPPPKIKKDETDDLLFSILNKKTLVGIDNQYDDDAEETPITFIGEVNNEIVFDYAMEDDEKKEALQSTSSLNSTPVSQNDWKNYTPQQLQTPISAPLAFPFGKTGQNSSEGDQKTLRKSSSRRRPTTIVKPMASSDVAKKYDILLDKRLLLVDAQLNHVAQENDLILKKSKHMEEENKLIIKKHKLEVEILELELKNKKNSTLI